MALNFPPVLFKALVRFSDFVALSACFKFSNPRRGERCNKQHCLRNQHQPAPPPPPLHPHRSLPTPHHRRHLLLDQVTLPLIYIFEPVHVCLHYILSFMSVQYQDQYHLDYESADCQDHSYDCLHPQLQHNDQWAFIQSYWALSFRIMVALVAARYQIIHVD